jgi:hypothetical protein
MSYLFLIPGCIALFLVFKGRVRTAFLSVYLPSLFLLPQDYNLRLPHLPTFSVAEFALIPVGIVALTRHIRKRSFRPMDALVFSFWVSYLITEVTRELVVNDGILAALYALVSQVMAYAVGRQLIEPELRFKTAKRILIFILLMCPFGIYEWRFGRSIYGIIGQNFLGNAYGVFGEGIQLRAGRGRLSVSFNGGEFAGMAIAITFALNAWLVFVSKARKGPSLGKWLAKLEKYHVPALLMAICVYLTQSRGALISLVAAFTILQIPRFKNMKVATAVVAVLFVVALFGAKQYFTHYLKVDTRMMTEQQSSAAYREVMNRVYQSIADTGGWFGWASRIPIVGGQKSIDNHFLLTHLIQGELGYLLLISIAAESVRAAIAGIWNFRALEDRFFACSMLAIFSIFWIAYYTVYMGAQMPQITFLMLGWGQSLVPRKNATTSVESAKSLPRTDFQRAPA